MLLGAQATLSLYLGAHNWGTNNTSHISRQEEFAFVCCTEDALFRRRRTSKPNRTGEKSCVAICNGERNPMPFFLLKSIGTGRLLFYKSFICSHQNYQVPAAPAAARTGRRQYPLIWFVARWSKKVGRAKCATAGLARDAA